VCAVAQNKVPLAGEGKCQQPVACAAPATNVIAVWLGEMSGQQTARWGSRLLKYGILHHESYLVFDSRNAQIIDIPRYSPDGRNLILSFA
jgi:hypothetical protein